LIPFTLYPFVKKAIRIEKQKPDVAQGMREELATNQPQSDNWVEKE
jgi:hypothetical protein